MIAAHKHPGKALWKTCEFQGLGGVFHTSSNSRHRGKNVAEQRSLGNVPGKCLWRNGNGKGTCKRVRKRCEMHLGNGRGKTFPRTFVRETDLKQCARHGTDTPLRKAPLRTHPETPCPGTFPKGVSRKLRRQTCPGDVPGVVARSVTDQCLPQLI